MMNKTSKRQAKEDYKKLNGWYLTPIQRATDSIKRAELQVESALANSDMDYAKMYIELIEKVCAENNITSKYVGIKFQ